MLAQEIYSPEGSAITIARRDRRIFVRAKLELPLKFMTDRQPDGIGKTVNVSANGILFQTRDELIRGEEIVCYIQDLGRLNGVITKTKAGHAVMAISVSDLKRDRLADQLIWLINKGPLNLQQDRAAERHAASGDLQVLSADGRNINCQVKDMSLLGVALKTTDARPALGEFVQVGKKAGTVVRYLDDGFAVEFKL